MNSDISILIVEDEIITVNFIKTGLEKYGFNDITYCLTAEQALVRVEETKPNLILLDISLEDKYSGIELAKVFTHSYYIPVIFVTGGIDDQTISKIEESEPYGLLFKPFRIQTLKVLISIAVKRMQIEQKKLESEKKLEISKLQLLDQVRELDTFFKISQLVNKFSSVEELIINALPLVPKAFNMSENISTRIAYQHRVYESENFEESKWVLSESLSKKYKTGDMIELYLKIDNSVESFPFSVDDINTFSAITQQLSLALQRFTFEKNLNNQLQLREMLNTILQRIIKISNQKISSMLRDLLRFIGPYFNSSHCQIILWQEKGGALDANRVVWTSKDEIPIPAPNRYILKDVRTLDKAYYLDAKNYSGLNLSAASIGFLKSIQTYGFLVIPIMAQKKQLGVIAILLERKVKYNFDDVSNFNIIGDIIAMAIAKLNRERKIRIYRQAIEQNPSTIVITDLDGKINYVNPMFTKTSGYTYKEAIGQNPRILKSGYQDASFYKDLWDTLTKGELWKGTFQNKCKDGSLVWELAVLSPIKDSDGNITGYIAIKEDISDKVYAEENLKKLNTDLVNTQASLIQEEKLASIGRLAAGVAHEINNPIGFVYSNFRTMGKYKENMQTMVNTLLGNNNIDQNYLNSVFTDNKIQFIMEDMDELLKESYDGFDRVINIVNSLRNFSRVDQLKSVVIYNLNEAIKTTLIIARNEIKYYADVEVEYGDIPKTMCNSSEINQVILNLLINAAQAIKEADKPGKGLILVKTYKEGNNICCEIKDSGPGIPDNVIANIFEPFFTTKPVGEGTGLGLNISYDIIVKKHEGELFAQNDENGGAVFTFKLPIIDDSKGAL